MRKEGFGRAEGARRKKMGQNRRAAAIFLQENRNVQAYFQFFSPAARSTYYAIKSTNLRPIRRSFVNRKCRSETRFYTTKCMFTMQKA